MKKLIPIVLVTFVLIRAERPEKVIERYMESVKLGIPVEYKNLKIYPLEMVKMPSFKDFTTLDEAMDKGWLKIKEVGNGDVNRVEIRNNGDEPVFILTGEMIVGAKQDRMIKEDILLPPNSGWIKVEVYCVEHGRWHEVSKEFKSGGFVVPNIVRQSAKLKESQSEVWAEVSRLQDKLGIVSETKTARANYEDKAVREAVEDYVKGFGKIPGLSKSAIGVIVTTGDRIICLDLFASNILLNKLWKKLIKSYAMDAIGSEKSTVTKEEAGQIIELIREAKSVSVGTPGLGSMLSIKSESGKGSALVYENLVVHMDFFPEAGSLIDKDSGLRLDFRRDQRLDE